MSITSISTTGGFVREIETSLGSLSTLLTNPQLRFAADQALRELNWSLPVSGNVEMYWLIHRGKRHALDLLQTISAYKFKYKNINLQQRFEHLSKMIWSMDREFRAALKDDPALMGLDVYKMFGTYLDNGFIYDQFGNDLTRYLFQEEGEDNDGYREYEV